jgi:hypothetical protein
MTATKNSTLFCAVLVGLLCFFPLVAKAETVVVFFSGLCTNAQTCSAAQSATASIGAQLPSGARILTPPPRLSEGAYADAAELQRVLGQLRGNNVVFVAYSAGHKALWQTVQGMDEDGLKRITDIVALESPYSGVTNAVARVRQVNPNVRVHTFTSGQFGGNHSSLPGNTGVATAIASLINGGGPPGTMMAPPYVPPTYAAYQPYGNGLDSLLRQPPPNSGVASPFSSAFGQPYSSSGYQPTTLASLGGSYAPTTYASPFTSLPPVSSSLIETNGSISNSVQTNQNTNQNTNVNTQSSVAVSNASSLGTSSFGSSTDEVRVSYSSSTGATSFTKTVENILAQIRKIIAILAERILQGR